MPSTAAVWLVSELLVPAWTEAATLWQAVQVLAAQFVFTIVTPAGVLVVLLWHAAQPIAPLLVVAWAVLALAV